MFTLRSNTQTAMAKRVLRVLIFAAIAPIISFHTLAAQKPQPKPKGTITLDGITFKAPKGYKLAPTQPTPESALVFGKYQDAIFFMVSRGPTPKDPSDVVKYSLRQLYPKESQTYSWKEQPLPKRISKFELSALSISGYNGSQLVKVVFRNVAIGEKVVAVGEIIEVARGGEARTMFDGNLEAISLGLCNVLVETIFPLTKERVDPKNPPCELIADVESIKP